MTTAFLSHLRSELEDLKQAGLYKSERVITSKQSGEIEVASGGRVLNFCANNYLGLADSEELAQAAKSALDRYGYGMASVRFICGTQEEHKELEARISSFLGSAWRTRFSIPPVSTRMAVCSRRCWARTTRSSPTR
ncbi:7-keto-8-aminopelargonate synthetase-like enzyme [Sinorhizobium meliloti]